MGKTHFLNSAGAVAAAAAAALVGILVSVGLGDAPGFLLLTGTLAASVIGVTGGALGLALRARRKAG